jgi:hypothetical protein
MMSDLASPYCSSAGRSTIVALALALSAVGAYVLAGIVDDGLYAVAGLLGLTAFAVGVKGRRAARRVGLRLWPATAAMLVGGLLGAAVLAFFVGWAGYHLVT